MPKNIPVTTFCLTTLEIAEMPRTLPAHQHRSPRSFPYTRDQRLPCRCPRTPEACISYAQDLRPRSAPCYGRWRHPCRSGSRTPDSPASSSDAPDGESVGFPPAAAFGLCRSGAGCRSPHGWWRRSRCGIGMKGPSPLPCG